MTTLFLFPLNKKLEHNFSFTEFTELLNFNVFAEKNQSSNEFRLINQLHKSDCIAVGSGVRRNFSREIERAKSTITISRGPGSRRDIGEIAPSALLPFSNFPFPFEKEKVKVGR